VRQPYFTDALAGEATQNLKHRTYNCFVFALFRDIVKWFDARRTIVQLGIKLFLKFFKSAEHPKTYNIELTTILSLNYESFIITIRFSNCLQYIMSCSKMPEHTERIPVQPSRSIH